MKIKFQVFIWVVLGFVCQIYGQQKAPFFKVGDPSRKGLLSGVINIVGKSTDGFYVLGTDKKGLVRNDLKLYKYNNQLQLEKSITIEKIVANKIYASGSIC